MSPRGPNPRPSLGRELSNLVGKPDGLCVCGPVRGSGPAPAERGSSSLGARIEPPAWVSPRPRRRRAGFAALRGECASGGWLRYALDPFAAVSFPAAFRPALCGGCCGSGGARRGSPGLRRWASPCVSGLGERLLTQPSAVRRAGRPGGLGRVWGREGPGRLQAEGLTEGGVIIFCPVTRKVRSQGGDGTTERRRFWSGFPSHGQKVD